MPQHARWDAPRGESCPPGCARGCAVTSRMSSKSCAPLAAPLCPPSCRPQSLPPLEGGCMGCCIIGIRGCGPLQPPVNSRAGWGCRQGGHSPHSSAAEREMAHPAAGTLWGISQHLGQGQLSARLQCPAARGTWAAPGACPDGLQAFAATLGPFSRSHICSASQGTAEAQLPPWDPDDTCQRDGHPAASTSLSVTPVVTKGQGCPSVNHCREQPGQGGREKLCHSQGCFPFISRVPQALKH